MLVTYAEVVFPSDSNAHSISRYLIVGLWKTLVLSLQLSSLFNYLFDVLVYQ